MYRLESAYETTRVCAIGAKGRGAGAHRGHETLEGLHLRLRNVLQAPVLHLHRQLLACTSTSISTRVPARTLANAIARRAYSSTR